MKNYEEISGIIIGREYQHVKLIAPNGRQQSSAYIELNESAVDWAKSLIESIKSEMLGNGLQLREYPDIFKQIYGDGDFTVLTDY